MRTSLTWNVGAEELPALGVAFEPLLGVVLGEVELLALADPVTST
jgi:hypothetical protein